MTPCYLALIVLLFSSAVNAPAEDARSNFRVIGYAKEKASGIMIWQLLGDAPGEKSLLSVINDVGYGRTK